MTMKCSIATARKFILSKQLLFSPRSVAGLDGIEFVFNNLRAIQYDSQSPCGTASDLSLQARVAKIHPMSYYQWLYQQRKGIEVYDKELTIVPIEDLPLCRGMFLKSKKRKLRDFLRINAKELKGLLEQIKRNGPICSSDLDDDRRVDIFWVPSSWSKAALDSLCKIGKLVISRRKNGRKYFDLPARVYGDSFICQTSGQLEYGHILRRLQGVGILPITGTGAGWQGVGSGGEIKPILTKLIEQGILVELEIAGIKNRYIINSIDSDLILSIKNEEPDRKISFLSPLDNLLWDRKMVRDIFGFDYKWETYTPISQRKFGHYVLPILYGSEFIGRIEPKYNKDENLLEIKGFWAEPNFTFAKDNRRAFFAGLAEFQDYLMAMDVKWLCKHPR